MLDKNSLPDKIAYKRIVIVDDTASIRSLAKTNLNSVGFKHVVELGNGMDALKHINEHPVDIVICDWDMPALSGIELLATLRHYKELKQLPFIMFTGSGTGHHIERAISEGTTDYIVKPFTSKSLVLKTLNALTKSKHQKVDIRKIKLEPQRDEE